ncbi:hypothetical protein ASPZODRAFT_141517 [Penicilliopsis zonata CBS 506.65]|uniref:PI-PLC Y-box domain-containing protein n=1 Tax=Penicilliopsis zonata CBS 506.65 TaxID=1073090 RepID=A0A1L9SL93_9EURO|nr:hypothetical protein ASPZODRAFT_141517 [Penicilliopsis zonata CBS 506.65]OJJ47965.1 hypothetical protein ASPZODRAFT_141517 [Penicilliopsis zonata CBS 506.65]
MSQPDDPTGSSIVMAEQSSHDVVNQTLSGGDPSPSDVPASTKDKPSAGGDVGKINDTVTTAQTETQAKTQHTDEDEKAITAETVHTGREERMDSSMPPTDVKSGPGAVASRALELNGVSSLSDGGEDTASQGGSESDASRTDGKSHGRAGSAKRLATFKPVSFARFSVPKAPGASAPSKLPDKAPMSATTSLGTLPPTSRPRLVAKTTSSLRDALSKAGPGGIKSGGGGPDPNQVWNKNRPVQPTPPKHLTDEELKQQYGIHMTSRIQEDGGGTEAKWADIDDDEDDWAPETIEWTDGTKVTLTHTDTSVPAQDDKTAQESNSVPPSPELASIPEAAKAAPKSVTSIGPNPTVLRLGANAERQAKSATILGKGAGDKLPSTSTSPAPVPSKSPWAPLPPVERISPVLPAAQTHISPRIPFNEPHPHDNYGGPMPPKEIAADDFNRNWRDSQPGGPRELYNSRSGRYEPVPETRRGGWRNEHGVRPPAVLQRPHGEQSGPEPSPAFQTHRTSAQDGQHWNRRRTLSNVSGGSGTYGRRMSLGRSDLPPRSLEMRRGSQVNGSIEPSAVQEPMHARDAPLRNASPSRHGPDGPWPTHPSVDANNMTRQLTTSTASEEAVPAPHTPEEDPVVLQERIMKEKRMEARQRRLDQEEKEEAAKRERIRLKLEALGPPPEKAKPKAKEVTDANKSEPTQTTSTTVVSPSPPKPPVPEPTGEPKQYGMMKVHHPDAVKKLVAANERTTDKPAQVPPPRRVSSPANESNAESISQNGIRRPGETQTAVLEKSPEAKFEEKGPHWRSKLNVTNTYSPWTSNSKLGGASSVANPWKPLSSDKTLGNGIFEQGLGGFQGRDLPLRGHLSLDQPALAGADRFNGPQRSQPDSSSISPLPSPEVRHAAYEPINPIGRPGPIGPPSSHSQWQPPRGAGETAAWNNFHVVAAKREAEEAEKLRQEMALREGPASLQVTFNETWRQVRTGDQPGQRQVIGITMSENNAPASNSLPVFDHPVDGLPFPDSHSRPFGIRGSRFFPHTAEPSKRPSPEEEGYMRSPSPPPPEEVSSHPVFTGDSHKPLVHLPAPKPIVKLPPKATSPPPPPPTFASMVAAPPRAAPQPVSTAASWQEKINGLFGKKTVPEKKSSLAVASASKEPLDVQLHIAAVSVSLPLHVDDGLGPEDLEVTSRRVEEEEEIFEDREAGSLPVVHVPHRAPANAWQAALPPPQSRLRSKNLRPMQVHSVEPFSIGSLDKDQTGNIRVSIRLPGANAAKIISLPKKAGGPPPPRSRGSSTFKARKGPVKPREGSGSLNSNPKKPASSQQTNGNGSSPRHQSRNASWGPRTYSGPH